MERGDQTQVHLKVQGKDYKALLTDVWMPGYFTYIHIKLYHFPIKRKRKRKEKKKKEKKRKEQKRKERKENEME